MSFRAPLNFMTSTDFDTIKPPSLSACKFRDPATTATGARRGSVRLTSLKTLWFNTGTLCNITCANCYIESSPTNDRLAYITANDVTLYLDEIKTLNLLTTEIGFTGGEPFMNPQFCDIAANTLARGFNILILTNAMQPLMRKPIMKNLLALKGLYPGKIMLRVSLDHFTRALHEEERGKGTWAVALEGLDWLSSNGFELAVAGRTCWGESEAISRRGYAHLFAQHKLKVDAFDPARLILFPEMDEHADVAEITEDCWKLLGKNPDDMMCASSRMVVKRKRDASPTVLPCTLLPYDDGQFDMGTTLKSAQGPVMLNHPHCAKFCVLGGGSCSG
jgi:Radical SAM superfamily